MDALEQSIIQGRPDATMMAGMSRTEAWEFLRDQAPYAISGGQEAIYALEPLMVEALGVAVTDPRAPQGVPEVHSTTQDVPEPNAPSPVVMRLELINIIVAKSGGKISFTKAGSMVDSIIAKQMIYYASMADPEVTTDEAARVAAVVEAKAMIEALIRQGGVVADYMADKPLWIRTATRARETCAKLVELIT